MLRGFRPFSRFVLGLAVFGLAGGLIPTARQGAAQGASGGAAGQGQGQRGGGRGAGQTGVQTAAPGPGGGQGRNQGRDGQNGVSAFGTGSIDGVVTLQGTGSPVRRAQVTLSGAEQRGQRSTTTNDQGRFSFAALPAGRFTLSVTKPGYVTITYGAKKPGRQGTPIQLAEGQAISNANLSLPRGSVITGVVVDESGEPSPNTQVRAYRYVFQNGVRSLQQAGSGQTDDRGIYRIFQLLPGDYLVSAVPRNQGLNDLAQRIQGQVSPLVQQAQGGGFGAFGGGPGSGGAPGNLLGGGRGQQLLDQVQQVQQSAQTQPDQSVAYAPVYYPGTTMSASAGKIALGIGEEHSGVDFQLQLVPTARIQGSIVSPNGVVPQGSQVSLQVAGQQDVPPVPGIGSNTTRLNPDGTFEFQNVTPGQYSLTVRAPIRQPDPNAAQAAQVVGGGGGRGGRGPGGRGGSGAVIEMLWASVDVSVDGRDVPDVTLNLQPGMTVSGRVAFESKTTPPVTDLTRVRVNLQQTGQAPAMGSSPTAQVDASGAFVITGVPPGEYSLRGSIGAVAQASQVGGPVGAAGGGGGRAGFGGASGGSAQGGWTLKSVLVNGRDTLDFPLEIKPNEAVAGAVLLFTDQTQELSGTLQDAMGRPTADYTIILFPADKSYWTPHSRRILSSRPGTDGTFSFRGLPAGQYRLTAVTDAESGEWFDPGFLAQIVGASMTLAISEGEKKTQDIRLAGGG